jgi:hypothetical protein
VLVRIDRVLGKIEDLRVAAKEPYPAAPQGRSESEERYQRALKAFVNEYPTLDAIELALADLGCADPPPVKLCEKTKDSLRFRYSGKPCPPTSEVGGWATALVNWLDEFTQDLQKARSAAESACLVADDEPLPPPIAKPEQGKEKGGKGRKPKTRKTRSDPKADKIMFDAWGTGQYRTFDALAQAKGISNREAKLAIDRHRKREAAKAMARKKPRQ